MSFFFYIGTSLKRRTDEVTRLNKLYADIVPVKHTLHKCLKFLCQKEPYRMLRDWSYDMSTDPLPSQASHPEFTDV